MKRFLLIASLIALMGVTGNESASALGLKVAPQQYRAELQKGERKKAFIDVGNPSAEKVEVEVSVQAFRQINDDGGLQFYDDKATSAGITPGLKNFELGPNEAVRMAFYVDGKLLPEGDVYAAIFLTSTPAKQRNGVGQLVRVGTLVSLVNVEPGERSAEITGLTLPFLQFSDVIKGSYTLRNTGDKNSGFYPEVTMSIWPGDQEQKQQASLLFGGRERQNEFSTESGLGFHRIDVRYGDSTKSGWVLLLQPWIIVLGLLVLLVVATELVILRRRRKQHRS